MTKILIAVILLSGFLLRVTAIDDVPFWFDELWTAIKHAKADTVSILWGNLYSSIEANLPLYPLLIFIWEKIFGYSEISLKFPSLIAGIFSIYYIYLLGKKVFSEVEGLIAASLMAFLTVPLYYSIEARSYSFLLLFTVLHLYSGMNGNRKLWYISSVCLCWLHYFGIFFIALQGIWDLFTDRKRLKFYLVPIVSILPLLPLMISHLKNGPNLLRSDSEIMMNNFSTWVFNSGIQELVILFKVLLGLMVLYTVKFFNKRLALLWYLSVTPVLVAVVFTIFIKPVFNEKYLIIILPSVYLLLSHGLKFLSDIGRVVGKVFIFGIIAISFAGALKANLKQVNPMPRIKESLQHISKVDTCEKQVLLPFQEQNFWNYYQKEFSNITFMAWDPDGEKEMSFWLVKGIYSVNDEQRLQWHLKKFDIVEQVTFYNSKLYCLKSSIRKP